MQVPAGAQPGNPGCVENTATRAVDGRMGEIDEVWMPCEVRRPQRVLPYAGGHGPSRAPQIAICLIRPSDTHKRPYCFYAFALSLEERFSHALALWAGLLWPEARVLDPHRDVDVDFRIRIVGGLEPFVVV
jgi:hypothetical protein